MKKKLFIATLVAIATLSFASCGHTETSDSSSTMLTTEQVEVEASINENGDAILNPDDSNIEIEETESGDKIATIKSKDGSEVKVAVKEDSKGNTVIDTTKVVTDNGTVKKADNNSKTEVKVDDKGSVTVVTTIPDTTESESSSKPVVTTTYDPTVEPPKSITTTYDPTVTPKTTTAKITTTPKVTTTPTSTTPKETTTTPKVTTTPKPTTTTEPKVTTTPAPTTTEAPKSTTTHTHSWSPVYKTVYHDTEYQTKTYWMYCPAFYQGADPTHIPFGPNRITPAKTGWYNRYTDYDLLCWYYGSLENVPNEYKVEWINKDTCGNYGLSSSAWNNIAKTGYDGLSIETTDYWGNKCAFNPNLDVLVTIYADASGKAKLAYEKQFGVSFCASSDSVYDCFMAVAQEQVKIKDAWTENVFDHYECSCGAHK